MNYQLISDLSALEQFVNWLPDLEVNERFYGCLFARKKYCPDLVQSNDKTQLKRFITTKQNLIDKIRQLECPVGSYKLKDRDVPQESLVVYINPNPRDMIKASFAGIRKLSDCLQNKASGFNPHAEILSCIQRSVSRKIYFDIDIDEPDPNKLWDVYNQIQSFINPDCLTYVQTRGGIHCLIRLDQIEDKYKKNWHKNITTLPSVDQTSDQLLPIVGCVQGGFTPKFL